MNLYSVIIALFAVGGAVLAAWVGLAILRKRKTAEWPATQAKVVSGEKSSAENQGLPLVKFAYQVDDRTFDGIVDVPVGEATMPEFADKFLGKYPIGSELTVYYDPSDPAEYTLKPGVDKEDWVLFYLGIATLILGAGFLLTGLKI